jgi:hypothetical protein
MENKNQLNRKKRNTTDKNKNGMYLENHKKIRSYILKVIYYYFKIYTLDNSFSFFMLFLKLDHVSRSYYLGYKKCSDCDAIASFAFVWDSG